MEYKVTTQHRVWNDIRHLSQGECKSPCKVVQLGMFSGFGVSRASNKGACNHDYFRCVGRASKQGLEKQEVKSCCTER